MESDTKLEKLVAETTCDSCFSRPLTVFLKPATSSVLVFCGHHASRHEAGLLKAGFIAVEDTRPRKQAKELAPAG